MNETKSTRGVTLRVVFVAALVLLFAAVSVGAVSAEGSWGDHTENITNGDGSESSPYEIGTAGQLAYLAQEVNAGNTEYNDKYYNLTADIDLGAYDWVPIGVDSSGNAFKGHFNGDGKTISNLKITRDSGVMNLGLFGAVAGTSATISNLKIENVEITGGSHLGSIVGEINYAKSPSIVNCDVSGLIKITGDMNVGGLVGLVNHQDNSLITISGCTITGESGSLILGSNVIGGVVGGSSNQASLVISDCISKIDVKGQRKLGGIVGQIFSGEIANVGLCTPSISNVKSYGNIIVSGTPVNEKVRSGTIVGHANINSGDAVTITNSESHGSIVGWDEISDENKMTVGLVGDYKGTVSDLRSCVSGCSYYVTSNDDKINLKRDAINPNELYTGGNLRIIGGSSEVRYKESIDYTVTIPALFDFGSNLALQSEVAVTVLVTDDENDVKMTVTEVDSVDQRELTSGSNKVIYNIGSAVGGTDILKDVFTADGSISTKQPKTLYFTLKEKPTHAGLYTGTLTFTTEVISASN